MKREKRKNPSKFKNMIYRLIWPGRKKKPDS